MGMAFVLLITEMGFEGDVLEDLKILPRVKEAFRLNGSYDIIIKAEANTRKDLTELISELRQMKKVRSTLTMIVI